MLLTKGKINTMKKKIKIFLTICCRTVKRNRVKIVVQQLAAQVPAGQLKACSNFARKFLYHNSKEKTQATMKVYQKQENKEKE